VHDDGADPEGENDGEREAEGHLRAGPTEGLLVVVVIEAHPVVGDADGETKREESGDGNPPAVEALLLL